MAASSLHQSADPHLQTSRSPRDASVATCGDAAFARAPQLNECSAFTLPGLPQPCSFALGLGVRSTECLDAHRADPGSATSARKARPARLRGRSSIGTLRY
jgi:hypothetical protein